MSIISKRIRRGGIRRNFEIALIVIAVSSCALDHPNEPKVGLVTQALSTPISGGTVSRQSIAIWPMFRATALHRGRAPSIGAQTADVIWSANVGCHILSSPAVATDGTVYIGSSDHHLYAVNKSGSVKWKTFLFGPVAASPAIAADGTVYTPSEYGALFALDPASGQIKWSYPTWTKMSSPSIGGDGTIYFGGENTFVYAISPNGTPKWVKGTLGPIYSSPAIDSEGTAYIASSWANLLYAFRKDGTLKWSKSLGGISQILSSPMLGVDGTLYLGVSKRLQALKADGTPKWSFSTIGEVTSSPALGNDGAIIFGSKNGYVYAVRDQGSSAVQLWRFKTGGAVESSAAVGKDGKIYVGSNDGKLYALKPDGNLLWSMQTGGAVRSSPAIAGSGITCMGSNDRKLYYVGGQIGIAVTLDKNEICSGESVTVSVDTESPLGPGLPIDVSIAGMPGSERSLQFTGKTGNRLISVVASTPDGLISSRIVSINVKDCSAQNPPPIPVISVDINRFHYATVDLAIGNTRDFEDPSVIYTWDFGDGQSVWTQFPGVAHSYADSLSPEAAFNNFEVQVRITRAGMPDAVGIKTITIWNDYAITKRRGSVRPISEETTPSIRLSGNRYRGAYTLQNPENAPLIITNEQLEFRSCTSAVAPTFEREFAISFMVPPRGKVERPFSVPSSLIGDDTCMAVYHLKGTVGSLPVETELYFDVPGRQARDPISERLQFLLNSAVLLEAVPNARRVTEEQLELAALQRRLVPVPPQIPYNAASSAPSQTVYSVSSNTPSMIGQECDPEVDLPLADISCQPTGQWFYEERSNLANAEKGDIILSKACGFVGGLLSKVTPPQIYSHTGMMVEDRFTIRHSTGDEKYVRAHPNGTLDMPTDGFEEQALKYVWPGALTATIEQAFVTGKNLYDSDNTLRPVKAFNKERIMCPADNSAAGPLVVKPSVLDAPYVRAKLRDAAERAKTLEGHYRFYAYSDGSIPANPQYNGPSGDGWGPDRPDGTRYTDLPTRATVCSAFVRQALKDAGITLDSKREQFYQDWGIPDGLQYYTEEERKAAGDYIYSYLYNEAQEKIRAAEDDYWWAGGLGGLLFGTLLGGPAGGLAGLLAGSFLLDDTLQLATDAPDDIGSQFANCFAFDDCSEDAKDSDAWKNPGVGYAVSPDDIKNYWDSAADGGAYGYYEPAIYRGFTVVQKYAWAPSSGQGILKVMVSYEGNPVPFAKVRLPDVFPNDDFSTNSYGYVYISPVPGGNALVEASKFCKRATCDEEGTPDDGELRDGQEVIYIRSEMTNEVTIYLQRPPVDRRRVALKGELYIYDEAGQTKTEEIDWEKNPGRDQIYLDRNNKIMDFNTIESCAGEETRIELDINAELINEFTGEIRVTASAKLYEGSCFLCSACDNNDHDGSASQVIVIDDEQSQSLHLVIQNTEEGSGEFGDINILVTNYRQN